MGEGYEARSSAGRRLIEMYGPQVAALFESEEAIQFTRFENTRSWYRNVFFPRVTSLSNPFPLDLSTLVQLFRKNRDDHFDPEKPGTDISMNDLLTVISYYLDYEFDNKENCKTHRIVQRLAGTIKELEDAIKD